MSRRLWPHISILAVLLYLCAWTASATAAPNILIIVSDDQRTAGTMDTNSMARTRGWFDTGLVPGRGTVTGGTGFPNAAVTTAQCCPSRSTIFTGLYAHNHEVKRTSDAAQLNDEIASGRTLQAYLNQPAPGLDYQTGMFGKYLNNMGLTNPPDFDRYITFEGNQYLTSRVNDQGVQRTILQYSTDYFFAKAMEFIDAAESDPGDRPWFLVVTPAAPHDPLEPAERHADASVESFTEPPSYLEQDVRDKPAWVRGAVDTDDTDHRAHQRQQLRMLLALDEGVDQIMQKIKDKGEEDNTLAIYVGDNGWHLGEHGLEGKGSPYRESVQTPLYMRWPGNPAVVPGPDSRLAENVDIAPTVLAAVNAPGPWPAMDGRSLLSGAGSRNRQLTEGWGATTAGRTFQSLRTSSFTYIETDGLDADNPPVEDVDEREYYDLTRDPYETRNLLRDDDPENDPPVAQLHAQLTQDKDCDAAQCPPSPGDPPVYPADTKITAAPDAETNSTSARFVFTSSVPTDHFECALDTATFSPCPASSRAWPYTVTFGGLASGQHTLSVRADSDGTGPSPVDGSPASHQWTVSATAPDTSITAKPDPLTNSATATFEFAGSPDTPGFECKLEADPPQAAAQFGSCDTPITYDNLSGVRHRFSVRAKGQGTAVDQTPATYEWDVDTTLPTPKANQPGGAGSEPPTLASSEVYFTPGFATPEDDDSQLTCMLDNRQDTLKPCAFRTPFSGIANGSHTLTVTGRDLAGNSASLQKPFKVDSMPTYGSVPDPGWPDIDDDPVDGSEVRAVIPDGSGGWYVGGNFTQVGGQSRTDLVHLTAQKQVDPSWAPSTGNGAVNALVLSGGTVYVAGTFTTVNGAQRNHLAALNAAGQANPGALDPQWNPDANQAVNDLEVAGGSIYVVGDFTHVGGADRGQVAELTAAGSATAWGQRLNRHSVSASLSLRAIEVTSSSVYVGGSGTISEVDAQGSLVASRAHLAEIDRGSGSVRSTLPQPTNSSNPVSVESLQLSPGSVPDSLFVGGRFSTPRSAAFQVDLSSGLETGWRPNPELGAGGMGIVYDVDATALRRPDGERRWSVMLGGSFEKFKAQYDRQNVAEATLIGSSPAADGFPTDWDPKLSDNVTDDNPDGPGNEGTSKVMDTATSGGVLAVGGDFSKAGYAERGDLAFFEDPPPDTEITGKISPSVTASHFALFSFRSSEPDHSTFECSLDGGAFSECKSPQPYYQVSDGPHRFEVRARDPRGTADATPAAHDWTVQDFAPDPNASWPQIGDGNDVRAIVPDRSGGWYVGGDFSTVCEPPFQPSDCHPHQDLVHINRDKTVDNSWNPSVQQAPGDPQPTVGVRALALSPKRHTLYVGGSFTQVNGVSSPDLRGLAAIDTGTGGALAWDPDVTNHVYALGLADDTGTIYAGGTLTAVKGQARGRIAEIRLDNAQPTAWNPNILTAGQTPQVLALAAGEEKLYAGGVDFGGVGSQTNTGNLVEIDRTSGLASTGWRPRPGNTVNPAANAVSSLALSRSGTFVYAGGSFTQVESAGTPVARNRAAAIDLDSTGTVRAWNPDLGSDVNTLLPLDTTVVLGGSFGSAHGLPRTNLAQIRADGTPSDWAPALDGPAFALASQATSAGRVLAVGGTFQNAGAMARQQLAFYGPPDS